VEDDIKTCLMEIDCEWDSLLEVSHNQQRPLVSGAEAPNSFTKGFSYLVPLYNLQYLKEELRHNFFPNILFKF
jgi:hypothetical protein